MGRQCRSYRTVCKGSAVTSCIWGRRNTLVQPTSSIHTLSLSGSYNPSSRNHPLRFCLLAIPTCRSLPLIDIAFHALHNGRYPKSKHGGVEGLGACTRLGQNCHGTLSSTKCHGPIALDNVSSRDVGPPTERSRSVVHHLYWCGIRVLGRDDRTQLRRALRRNNDA